MFSSSGGSSSMRRNSVKCETPSSSSPNVKLLAVQVPLVDTRAVLQQPAVSLCTAPPIVPNEILILQHENVGQTTMQNTDESSNGGPSKKRKKQNHHHYTDAQINVLEASFAECDLPDEERRRLLSAQLGMTKHQVKFWFQNRRNQVKTHNEKLENLTLKEENELIKEQNIKMKQALRAVQCPGYGGTCAVQISFEGRRLMLENQYLKQQIEQTLALIGRCFVEHVIPVPDTAQDQAARVFAAANSAIVELLELVKYAEPLWICNPNRLIEVLNEAEYIKFLSGISLIRSRIPGLANYEVSRASDIVMLNCRNIIEIMMNPTYFTTFFPSLVSRSRVRVCSTPYPNSYHGAIHLMTMECHTLSPLVPWRVVTFLRHCQQRNEGLWAIVDISVTPEQNQDVTIIRRPSGCILQEISHDMTKVIWIEHIEVDNYSDIDIMYQQAVRSGIVFGARRWLSSLKRQSELLANINSSPIYNAALAAQLDEKKNIFKLAEKMIITFFNSITGTPNDGWATYAGMGTEHDIKITSQVNASDPGKPYGIVLCASASFWLPVPIQRAFEILFTEAVRSELEALSFQSGNAAAASLQIARGLDPANNISIVHLVGEETSGRVLRQNFFDPMGAYIIYSPIETAMMQLVLKGENLAYIPMLPSGFVVIPNAICDQSKQGQPGSLVTVGYQMMVDTNNLNVLSIDPAAIAKVRELIVSSCRRIKASVPVPANVVLSAGPTVT